MYTYVRELETVSCVGYAADLLTSVSRLKQNKTRKNPIMAIISFETVYECEYEYEYHNHFRSKRNHFFFCNEMLQAFTEKN